VVIRPSALLIVFVLFFVIPLVWFIPAPTKTD
jgi:hypothetical protein